MGLLGVLGSPLGKAGLVGAGVGLGAALGSHPGRAHYELVTVEEAARRDELAAAHETAELGDPGTEAS